MPLYNKDIFQVTVFGSGYGESVIVHVGNNEWLVVDSCLDSENGCPCAINYFESLGVDMATSVKHIFASHWDTDHILGLSEIVKKSKNATFHISSSFNNPEFLVFVYGQSELGGISKKSVKEFLEIIEELSSRKGAYSSAIPIDYVMVRNEIKNDNFFLDCQPIHREIIALSPSSAAITKGLCNVAKLIPNRGDPRKEISKLKNNNLTNNHTSIVLWVKVGETGILLGSDLEELGFSDDGWENIVNIRARPSLKAKFFKIPHHGSETAHHDRVWREMIDGEHVSVVTSFNCGNVRLPYQDDIGRIVGYSDRCYLVGALKVGKKARFDRATDKTLNKLNMQIERLSRKTGRITLSKYIGSVGDWNIDFEGETHQLSSLLSSQA